MTSVSRDPHHSELQAALARLKTRVTDDVYQSVSKSIAGSATPLAIHQVELALVNTLALEELREHVAALAQRFVDDTTQKPTAMVGTSDTQVALRAYAEELSAQICEARGLRAEFARKRGSAIKWMFALAMAISLPTFVAALSPDSLREFYVVIIAGAAGGLTSCLRRVYAADPNLNPGAALEALNSSTASMIAAPLLGAIFAVALHLCFVGGLVSGVLFPTLTLQSGAKAIIMADFLKNVVRATPANFAKLTLWCFVAGFAERFVPDLLDSFVTKASAKKADA